MAKKVKPSTSIEIKGEVFPGDEAAAADETATPAAGWAWLGKVWTAIKPSVPSVYASIITAIVSLISAYGGTLYSDYSGAAKASSEVSVALKDAGDKTQLRIDAAKEMNTASIDAMAASCATTFAKVLKEQMAAKRTGRSLNF